MAFPDPVVAGDKLVVPAIQSADWIDGGSAGWQINRDGSASFNNVSLNGNLGAGIVGADEVDIGSFLYLPDGTELSATIPNHENRIGILENGIFGAGNIVAHWTQTDSPLSPTGAFADTRIIGCDFTGEPGHIYLIRAYTNWTLSTSTDVYRFFIRIKTGLVGAAYPATPLAADTAIAQTVTGPDPQTKQITGFYGLNWTDAETNVRIVLTINRVTGTGTIQQQGIGTGYADTRMVVMDMGTIPALATNWKNFNGYNSTDTPSGTAPPPAPKTYTKTYNSTWSRTYDGNNATTWDDSPYCYQGYYSSTRANTKSLAGFAYATIQADLAGATINSCYVTVKGAHAYYNSGMTCEIGTHNYTAKPSTWAAGNVTENRVASASLAAGTTRKISLGTGIGGEFKSGSAKGISFGPGPTTSLTYYGYVYGATQSGKPYLTITYTK